MKFGKALRAACIEGWSAWYVNYKGLKKLIKAIEEASGEIGTKKSKLADEQVNDDSDSEVKDEHPLKSYAPTYEGFLEAISAEGDKIDAFYAEQMKDCEEQLRLVERHQDRKLDDPDVLDQYKAELGLMYARLDNLRGYVLLNHLAFAKILKKFDKRCHSFIRDEVLKRIQSRPFYHSHGLADLITQAQCAADILVPLSTVREEYACPLCHEVLRNPVVLSCAHRFCWECLGSSAFGGNCPVCQKQQSFDPAHFRPDSTLQHFLSEYFPPSSRDSASSRAMAASAMRLSPPPGEPSSEPNAPPTTTPSKSKKNKLNVTRNIDVLLEHLLPGTIVVVDIDETVVMSPHQETCMLLTSAGIKSFQKAVDGLRIKYDAKVRHCRNLQSILDMKVLVEGAVTVTTLHKLQLGGCWCMGLTSRIPTLAVRTQQTLQQVGLSFNVNSPLPVDQAFQDPDTRAVFANGIVYTGAFDKGEVLDRFLCNVLFNTEHKCLTLPDSKPAELAAARTRLPSQLVFIDDRIGNVESVLARTSFLKQHNIPIFAYHYTAVEEQLAQHETALPKGMSEAAELELEIQTFINEGRLITRAAAATMWQQHQT